MCDSENTDVYFYLMTVYTGLRRDGGTQSNVNFIVGGEDCDSGVRVLSDGLSQVTLLCRIFIFENKYTIVVWKYQHFLLILNNYNVLN